MATITNVREAVQLLARHPLIGRLVDTYRRELIISKRRTGYVALYRWFDATETALVLRVVINVKRDIREFRQGSPSGVARVSVAEQSAS